MKKFNKYVYGRVFTLVTGHQPLTTTFGPKRGTPTLPAARMQRGALLFSAYTDSTKAHANADGLSRVPLEPVARDGQILAKACTPCQSQWKAPPKAPLAVWPWSSTLWERVHVDFLGPFLGKMILVATYPQTVNWPQFRGEEFR